LPLVDELFAFVDDHFGFVEDRFDFIDYAFKSIYAHSMLVGRYFEAIDAISAERDALSSFIEEHRGERNDHAADTRSCGNPILRKRGLKARQCDSLG
jgi:hypothetical protein